MSEQGGTHESHPINLSSFKDQAPENSVALSNVVKWQRKTEWEPRGSVIKYRTFFSIVCGHSLLAHDYRKQFCQKLHFGNNTYQTLMSFPISLQLVCTRLLCVFTCLELQLQYYWKCFHIIFPLLKILIIFPPFPLLS